MRDLANHELTQLVGLFNLLNLMLLISIEANYGISRIIVQINDLKLNFKIFHIFLPNLLYCGRNHVLLLQVVLFVLNFFNLVNDKVQKTLKIAEMQVLIKNRVAYASLSDVNRGVALLMLMNSQG